MNKFFKCSCCCHLLEIEKDEEDLFSFTIWELGYDGKLSWREKIRWMWHILVKGKPWADHVLLTREQIREMRQFLQKDVIIDERDEVNKYKEYIDSLSFKEKFNLMLDKKENIDELKVTGQYEEYLKSLFYGDVNFVVDKDGNII